MNVDALPPEDSPSDPSGARARPRWPLLMALAAGAGLIVVSPWASAPTPARLTPEPTEVDDGSVDVTAPVKEAAPNDPQALSPVGRIPARPDEFTFRPGGGARSHSIHLYDAEGQLLWSSEEVTGKSCPFPASVSLEEGRYFWQVIAQTAGSNDPRKRLISPLVEIEIYSP